MVNVSLNDLRSSLFNPSVSSQFEGLEFQPFPKLSLSDLINVARFSNDKQSRAHASSKLIGFYEFVGAYRDLVKITTDFWFDGNYKKMAEESISSAMLSFYLRSLNETPNDFKIDLLSEVARARDNISQRVFSFEFVAKDTSTKLDDRLVFADVVLSSWSDDGFHNGVSHVAKNRKSVIKNSYSNKITELALTYLQKSAENLFVKIEKETSSETKIFPETRFYSNLYGIILDSDLSNDFKLEYSRRLLNSISATANGGFFRRLYSDLEVIKESYNYINSLIDIVEEKIDSIK